MRLAVQYDLTALQILVNPPAGGLDLDDLDWSELRRAAERGGALVRVADAVSAPPGGEPLPPRFSAAVAAACTAAQRVVELVGRLSARCDRLGLGHLFLRTVEAYPDAAPAIELLIGHPRASIDADVLADVPAARRRAPLHHWLANVTSYSACYGVRIVIRHGRVGRLGEHARYARLLLTRARPMTIATTACPAPSRADHLLLLAMHQLYTRPAFRLSDVYGAIESIRTGRIDWDYLFATALSLGIVPAVAAYLHYVDRLYRTVTPQSLLPSEALTRFRAAPDAANGDSADFPRMPAAARLYLQHVRTTLESGRWQSAARLSLLPLVAALTGARRAGTRA